MGDSHSRSQYDEAALDLERLQRYASRVARETKRPRMPAIMRVESRTTQVRHEREVGLFRKRVEQFFTTETRSEEVEHLGEHWVLFRTFHHLEENSKQKMTEYNEENLWTLTVAGSLWHVHRWKDYTYYTGARPGVAEEELRVVPMAKEHILELDRAHPRYSKHSRELSYHGDRTAGRIIRHAPGVGLSMHLRGLLTP